jgi:hypothetical protein
MPQIRLLGQSWPYVREAYAARMETHTHQKKQNRKSSLKSTFLAVACLLFAGVSEAKPFPQATLQPLAATASFAGLDTTTRGNWHGVYGSDGYSVANDAQSIPSYASFAVQNQQSWTWATGTVDPRALQTCDGSSKLAATWYNSSKFNFDVNLTDGHSHQLAIYALDWDRQGRSETIQIVDANTLAALDSRTISNFTGGTYLIWTVTGHVKINITALSGPNSVIAAVFFGSISTPASAGTGQVSVSPTIFNFGSVNLGGANSQTFTVTNFGTAALNISQMTVSGTGLSVTNSALPISLSVGQSTSAVVKFAPASLGSISGLLTITSNAANSSATIAISGTGAGISPTITTQPASETVTAGNVAGFSVANTRTETRLAAQRLRVTPRPRPQVRTTARSLRSLLPTAWEVL